MTITAYEYGFTFKNNYQITHSYPLNVKNDNLTTNRKRHQSIFFNKIFFIPNDVGLLHKSIKQRRINHPFWNNISLVQAIVIYLTKLTRCWEYHEFPSKHCLTQM